MRDPKRIPMIMNLIEEIWKKKPDQRLFQLLENIFGCPLTSGQCLFHQEDDITQEELEVFLETGQ